MFILIGIVAILLYVGLVFYIGWSGWRFMQAIGRNADSPYMVDKRKPKRKLPWFFKLVYILTLIIVSTSFILGRFFDNVWLDIIGAYWIAVFYLLIVFLPLAHVCILLFRLTPLPRHRVERLVGSITLVALIALIGYGSFCAYSPVVRTYDIHIAKHHSSESLKIAMASDMHFGVLSGKSHAARLVREINALQPDVVLFPGDLFDDGIQPYVDKKMDQILNQIQATYGVYASLGNHDHNRGSIDELINILNQSNVHVLYDETVAIDDQFTLIGRRDRSDRGRLPLSALMAEIDHNKPLILVDHQPYDLDIAQQLGIDLMVSGHTHRGQIAPAHFLTKLIFENDWGHLQKEQLHSIVSSGFGFWGPPIRLGTRSEIVEINVNFEPSSVYAN